MPPTKRELVVAELLETEGRYVAAVELLMELVVKPLREGRGIVSEQDVSTIFGNLEHILELNTSLLQQLVDTQAKGEMRVGGVFKGFGPYFRLYSVYLCTYEEGMDRRAELLAGSKAFRTFLSDLEADPQMGGLKLADYLIMPVQRIPRYELLLNELLKATDEDNPDYEDLVEALERIARAAAENNESLRYRETRAEVLELMSSIDLRSNVSNLLEFPNQALLRTGTMAKLNRRGPKSYTFWLLRDRIMYGEPSTTKLKFKINREIMLRQCRVSMVTNVENTDKAMLIESAAKSFIVWALHPQDKLEWMDAIHGAQRGVRIDMTEVAPLWVPDSAVTNCETCATKFTVLNRRHHCRKCGKIVCATCSRHKWRIDGISTKKDVRVCDGCFVDLSAGTTTAASGRDGAHSRNASEEASHGVLVPTTIGLRPESAMSRVQSTMFAPQRHGGGGGSGDIILRYGRGGGNGAAARNHNNPASTTGDADSGPPVLFKVPKPAHAPVAPPPRNSAGRTGAAARVAAPVPARSWEDSGYGIVADGEDDDDDDDDPTERSSLIIKRVSAKVRIDSVDEQQVATQRPPPTPPRPTMGKFKHSTTDTDAATRAASPDFEAPRSSKRPAKPPPPAAMQRRGTAFRAALVPQQDQQQETYRPAPPPRAVQPDVQGEASDGREQILFSSADACSGSRRGRAPVMSVSKQAAAAAFAAAASLKGSKRAEQQVNSDAAAAAAAANDNDLSDRYASQHRNGCGVGRDGIAMAHAEQVRQQQQPQAPYRGLRSFASTRVGMHSAPPTPPPQKQQSVPDLFSSTSYRRSSNNGGSGGGVVPPPIVSLATSSRAPPPVSSLGSRSIMLLDSSQQHQSPQEYGDAEEEDEASLTCVPNTDDACVPAASYPVPQGDSQASAMFEVPITMRPSDADDGTYNPFAPLKNGEGLMGMGSDSRRNSQPDMDAISSQGSQMSPMSRQSSRSREGSGWGVGVGRRGSDIVAAPVLPADSGIGATQSVYKLTSSNLSSHRRQLDEEKNKALARSPLATQVVGAGTTAKQSRGTNQPGWRMPGTSVVGTAAGETVHGSPAANRWATKNQQASTSEQSAYSGAAAAWGQASDEQSAVGPQTRKAPPPPGARQQPGLPEQEEEQGRSVPPPPPRNPADEAVQANVLGRPPSPINSPVPRARKNSRWQAPQQQEWQSIDDAGDVGANYGPTDPSHSSTVPATGGLPRKRPPPPPKPDRSIAMPTAGGQAHRGPPFHPTAAAHQLQQQQQQQQQQQWQAQAETEPSAAATWQEQRQAAAREKRQAAQQRQQQHTYDMQAMQRQERATTSSSVASWESPTPTANKVSNESSVAGLPAYEVSDLRGTLGQLPEDVDPDQREDYLTQEQFERLLGMSYDAFQALPGWKRQRLKRDAGIF